jgi:prolyl 4-hydroxylase
MPTIDDTWTDWLATNISRGCTADSMIEAMTQAGFSHEAATQALRQALGGVVVASPTPQQTGFGSAYRYEPAPVSSGNVIHAYDREVRVLARCERPQILALGNVLSAEECDEMIERARPRLRRSTIIDPETGAEDVIDNRSSEGIWFHRCEDPFIERIDRRISALMNWPLENGEGLQIMRYGVGAEYRPHFDYFPPERSGSAVQIARGGQRVATLVLYLNDVEEGGATSFPEAGLSVTPQRGNAVYFRYMNSARQLDPLTLHAGAPVLRGEKWIATKWVRERAHA